MAALPRSHRPATGIGANSAAESNDGRSDELEPRREDHMPTHARDSNEAVLERLSKRLDNGAWELRELGHGEHASMGGRALA